MVSCLELQGKDMQKCAFRTLQCEFRVTCLNWAKRPLPPACLVLDAPNKGRKAILNHWLKLRKVLHWKISDTLYSEETCCKFEALTTSEIESTSISLTHSLDSWLLIQPARSPVQATKCPRRSSALSLTWRDSTFQKSRSRVFLWKRCGRCGLLINVSGKKLCFEHLRACKVQPAENEVASCKCYVSIPSLWPKPRRQVSSPWAQRQFAQELASKRETLVPRDCNPKHCSTGVPFGLSNPSA